MTDRITSGSGMEFTESKFASFGALLRGAGVAPERVEIMICEIITGVADNPSSRRLESELEALRSLLGDGLEQIRMDQILSLQNNDRAISMLLSEAEALQGSARASSRMIRRALLGFAFFILAIASAMFLVGQGTQRSLMECLFDVFDFRVGRDSYPTMPESEQFS